MRLSPLSASLLRLRAPTLEPLARANLGSKKEHSFAAAGLNSAPSSPCHRSLKPCDLDFLDSFMLDAFLQSKLQTLYISHEFDSVLLKLVSELWIDSRP